MSAMLTWIAAQATENFLWSVLQSAWTAWKNSSLVLRVTFLLAASAVVSVTMAAPGLVLLLSVLSDPKIPLPESVSTQIRTAMRGIPHTISADLLRENVPRDRLWKVAQVVLASKDFRATHREQLLAHVKAQIDSSCRCWSPGTSEHPAHIAESAWILYALGSLAEGAPAGAVDFLLDHQDRETGAWPIHADGGQEFASTYATALSLLALNSHFVAGTLPPREAFRAKRAIAHASDWIRLQQSPGAARWSDYPERGSSRELPAVSGLVLYSLHQLEREDLTELDRLWLSTLPDKFPAWNALDRVDDLRTTSATSPSPDALTIPTWPWLLVATSTAYNSGTLRERHKAARWIHRAFAASGLSTVRGAELSLNPEILIALREVSAAAGTYR